MIPFRCLLLVSSLTLASCPGISAEGPGDREAARQAFTTARGLFSTDIEKSVAELRRAIDLDPDYFEGHQYYILYSKIAASRTGTDEEKKAGARRVSERLVAQYEAWAREYPDKAVYRCGLGSLFQYEDPDRAYAYFLEAAKIDPRYGEAYDSLALCAEIRGDLEQAMVYRRKAVEVAPDNPVIWGHLIGSLREANIDEGVTLGLEFSKRFPGEAARIMGYLASRARNEAKSREIYELLRARLPKESAQTLTGLFSIYLRQDPAMALSLAQEMAELTKDEPRNPWTALVDYAQAVVDAGKKAAAGKGAEALEALEALKLPRYGVDRRVLDLTRARVRAQMGETNKAYADLAGTFARTPSDELRADLLKFGAALGRSEAEVEAEIAGMRAKQSKAGIPFRLTDYRTGREVSLDDYRGRVVLVNFWYPMCGPCRGEFPFLQAVLEKYRRQGFEILAINAHEAEDHLVLPLLKGWELGFLPLKSDGEVDRAYGVRGYPSNFLYSADGRIVYEPPPVSTIAAQRELELQIEALLAAPSSVRRG